MSVFMLNKQAVARKRMLLKNIPDANPMHVSPVYSLSTYMLTLKGNKKRGEKFANFNLKHDKNVDVSFINGTTRFM